MIAKINVYKGKQELYKQQAPQILDTLKEVAIIQSTKALNAIEGIIITDSRLKSIMENDTNFQDRSEGGIAGYRDILQLYKELYKYSGKFSVSYGFFVYHSRIEKKRTGKCSKAFKNAL